jgi:LysR family transcriptional regulator for metE and metH
MYIEFRHLRSVKAIHEAGGLGRAAEILNITQSALSHQVKGLEEQAGLELFVRRTKPLKMTAAGIRMLALADKIIPEI